MGVLLTLWELAVYTRFPLQMVLSTPAVTVQPSKGVARPWEKKVVLSMVWGQFRSSTVRSAISPASIFPPGS